MGKLTIQELAKILVEKNKLTTKEANQFAATMFEIIQQQLDSEGLVKIKGLGTFKMIRVEARESVSVRTGERVTIDSHTKISFTPDATMKELVNKPFSQFETVVLNDGVEFEDMPEEAEDTVAEESVNEEKESENVVVPTNVEPAPDPIASPLIEIVDETPEQDIPINEAKEEPVIMEEEEQEEEEEEETNSWKKTFCYILLTLALMAASAYGGYWYGQKTATPPVEVKASEALLPDSVETKMAEADSLVAIEDTIAKEPIASEVKKKAQDPEEDFWKKYEAMDIRVRTGAYHIIGTDHEVKVRKGETLNRITRRELGDGMSCYIEVYNDLKPNTELQEGQIIKIPKLKWKKKKVKTDN